MINSTNHKNLFMHPLPEDVFCECYTQFRDELYAYLLMLTGDADVANNLIQNVFLKFWTVKDQYPRIGNAKAYLKRMAGNAFRDTRQQDKNRLAYIQTVSEGIEVSINLTENLFDERELQKKIQQAILDLSRQRRIVYVLSQIEGLPRQKIASILEISPFTVKVTLQKALREVRKKCGLHYQFSINNSK